MEIELFEIREGFKIICTQADTFPEGIGRAFQTLEQALGKEPDFCERPFFGVSQGSKEGIIYKAAVLQTKEGEGEKHGFETFTVLPGKYLCINISNWRNNESTIGMAFTQLLEDKRMDTSFPCLEWYNENNVKCLVKSI